MYWSVYLYLLVLLFRRVTHLASWCCHPYTFGKCVVMCPVIKITYLGFHKLQAILYGLKSRWLRECGTQVQTSTLHSCTLGSPAWARNGALQPHTHPSQRVDSFARTIYCFTCPDSFAHIFSIKILLSKAHSTPNLFLISPIITQIGDLAICLEVLPLFFHCEFIEHLL